MYSFTSKKRILILDKDTRLTNFVNEISLDGKYDIYTSETSEGLSGMAREVKPHLILLDYAVVDADCQMICQSLKEDEQLKKVPLVVITATGSKKQLSDICKCDALFVKPQDTNAVSAQIFFGDIKNYFTYLMMKMGNPYAFASA
jgi:two-component system cell cycle response regulator DivK